MLLKVKMLPMAWSLISITAANTQHLVTAVYFVLHRAIKADIFVFLVFHVN